MSCHLLSSVELPSCVKQVVIQEKKKFLLCNDPACGIIVYAYHVLENVQLISGFLLQDALPICHHQDPTYLGPARSVALVLKTMVGN